MIIVAAKAMAGSVASFPRRNACGPHIAEFSTSIVRTIASEHPIYFGNRYSAVQKRYSRKSPQ